MRPAKDQPQQEHRHRHQGDHHARRQSNRPIVRVARLGALFRIIASGLDGRCRPRGLALGALTPPGGMLGRGGRRRCNLGKVWRGSTARPTRPAFRRSVWHTHCPRNIAAVECS